LPDPPRRKARVTPPSLSCAPPGTAGLLGAALLAVDPGVCLTGLCTLPDRKGGEAMRGCVASDRRAATGRMRRGEIGAAGSEREEWMWCDGCRALVRP
jgi:hypothetical protein